MSISKSHARNRDKYLDLGGAYEISAAEIGSTFLQVQTDLVNKIDKFGPTYDTLMLLHFEGLDGAKTTTDATGRHSGFSFANQTHIETDDFKFGSSSIQFDGTTDALVVSPDSDDFVIFDNTTNRTLDFWVKHISAVGGQYYFTQYVDGSNYWYISAQSVAGQGVGFYAEGAGQGTVAFNRSDVDIKTDGQWHHIALVSIGTVYALYIDGQQTTYQNVSLTAPINIAANLIIGADNAFGQSMNGYMDEIRITDGNIFGANPNVGETDTITVPTAPGTADIYIDAVAQIDPTGALIRSTTPISDLQDSVTKKHTQNADTYLDFGGSNQVSATQIKTGLVDFEPVLNLNVSSYLEFDGLEGSARCLDLTGNYIWNTPSNSYLSATEKKFGSTSLYKTGYGTLNTVHTGGAFDTMWDNTRGFGFFLKFDVSPTTDIGLFQNLYTGTTYWSVDQLDATGIRLKFKSSGTDIIVASSAGIKITDTNWHHLAMVKIGNNWQVALDGAIIINHYHSAAPAIPSGTFSIGITNEVANPFVGYIDNLIVDQYYFNPPGGAGNPIVVPTAPLVDTIDKIAVFAGNQVVKYSDITYQEVRDLVDKRLNIPTGVDQASAGALAGELWADSSAGYVIKLGI